MWHDCVSITVRWLTFLIFCLLLQIWSLKNDAGKDGVSISAVRLKSSAVRTLKFYSFTSQGSLSSFYYLCSFCFPRRRPETQPLILFSHAECGMEWGTFWVSADQRVDDACHCPSVLWEKMAHKALSAAPLIPHQHIWPTSMDDELCFQGNVDTKFGLLFRPSLFMFA